MTEEQFVDLTQHTKKLKIRLIASIVLFLVFFALGVTQGFINHPKLEYAVVGVFLLSFLLLPRETFPRQFRKGSISPEDATFLNKMRLKLSYTRVAYFVSCLFILFGLPKIL